MNNLTYKWFLKDIYNYEPRNNLNVFSCFSCCGGSSMGYKLAGYNVIGCCEIDKTIIEIYKKNLQPKYAFNCDIRDLINENLPQELYNIDILDGSPPCSVFSIAGKREEGWNKEKYFREGQKKQKLDDLFFYFIVLAEKIKPKVIVAENVKGLLLGNSKYYVKQIMEKLNNINYHTKIFLLNASTMGVPQKRERVFFISIRNDIKKNINLSFNEKPIIFKEISDEEDKIENLSNLYSNYWDKAKYGEPIGKFQAIKKVNPNLVLNTITTKPHYHYKFKRILNKKEICLGSSFPLDYNFMNFDYNFACGMSVPPIVMYKISKEIYKQIFRNE